jgi:signal transduction histidine kinase
MNRARTQSGSHPEFDGRGAGRRYAAAVLAGLGALLLTALLRPWLGQTIYLFFFPAVMVSAWYGGLLAGSLVALVGASMAAVIFLEPVGSLKVTNLASLATAGVLVGIAWLVNKLSRAVDLARAEVETRAMHLEEQAIELEMQAEENQQLVDQLERANEHLQEAAVQAQSASRAKSAFLATMSHELRTPLNAIDGYAELLEMGIYGKPTPEQAKAIERIRVSHAVLLEMVDQVLDQARVEAGKLQLDYSPVPLSGAIETACAIAEPLASAKEIELGCEPTDPSLAAWADNARLQQILVNLLTNAVKFSDPGGTVTLSCSVAGDQVRIRVTDTGAGIPDDKLEPIFEPFYQLDQSSTRVAGGAGLGLTISRDLARAMGGEISVCSQPGVGSTFTVTLPLYSAARLEAARS